MDYLSITDPKAKTMILVSGGGATSLVDLQFAAGVAEDEDFSASALVCLNSSRRIAAGLGAATSMPLWAINGAQDYDSNQYRTNLMKGESTSDQGVVNTLVGSGGFELSVTEYNDTDYVATDYTPGSQLLVKQSGTDGFIEPAPADYSNYTVVGCTSYGIETTRVGINRARMRLSQKKLLRFWTLFLPPTSTST